MNANEQFLVRHYAEDEKPILKGHGFDGLEIGNNREEAQEFVDYLNAMLRQQQAEIEQCKREIDELYESLKEAVNDHKITHLHPFWIEYRKRKAQEK